MVEKTKKIWLDGEFVDWNKAQVHVLTHTLHYGMGAFEGIRCYECVDGRSAIFRLPEHIRRMFDGLKILTMEPPYTEEEIIKACVELVKINSLKECYIRPVMFCGDGAMGLYAQNPTRCTIIAWPWGEYLGKGATQKGIRAKVSSFNRYHVNIGMVQGKLIGQYISSILAKREVVKSGYGEAIMLDVNGYVAEGSGENIFVVRDGIIRTPPMSSPILAGITRDAIIKLARDFNYDLREETFTRDYMYICDEVFLTGTAAEITPVCEVDDRLVNGGKPGPITMRLQKAFYEIVRGESEKYKEWLTIVK